MKLDRLHHYRDQFKKKLRSEEPYSCAFKWECQEIFQRVWDLEALEFELIYDRALSHPASGSLWGGNHQSAKSIMIEFIRLNREFVRSMFRDLFSNQRDLSMRIERFHFHCDQLLEQYREKNKRVNHHFHHDYHMPTLYLALRYPEQFCVFDQLNFSRSLARIDAKNPLEADLVRFTKVIPIFQSQLLQDSELIEILKEKILLCNEQLYRSVWLSYEFYMFIAVQKI